MKLRLLLLAALAVLACHVQSQSPYTTVDTSFAGFLTTISYVAGNTDSTEAVFVIHGSSERGTTTNYSYRYGPHYWMNHGWNGAVPLGNGVHYPIYITLQRKRNDGTSTPPNELKPAIDSIRLRFPNIKKTGFHAMCLSLGFAEIGDFITRADVTNYYATTFKSVVNIEGYNTKTDSLFGHWAKQFGGRMLGFGQINDANSLRRRYGIIKNMNDSVAGSGYWLWTRYGDSDHCCFNSMYDPSATNWTGTNPYVVTTAHGFTIVPIAAGQNVYQWALRQGDTTLYGKDVACSSMQFDGIDDYVKVPDYTLSGNFTIESWVKLAASGSNQDVVIGHETLGRSLNFYDNKFRLYDASASPTDVIVAKTTNPVGIWTHYAITRSGSTVSLYINGQLDTARNTSWTSSYALQNIGRMKTSYYLAGNLDEVRIWSVARTAAQISANYNKMVADTSTGLLGYYKFNEDSANQVVFDASSNGRNGTLGANTTVESADPHRTATTYPSLVNGCQGTVNKILRTNTVTQTEMTESPASIRVYPNPTSGATTISIHPAHSGLYVIRVTDISGRTFYYKNLFISSLNEAHIQVALPTGATGMYLVQVTGNGAHKTAKILKSK